MTMKKSELRSLIREMLQEELSSGSYLTEAAHAPENALLATKVTDNPGFESACLSGNATEIMAIIDGEMQANNMFTAGAKKFRNDVFRMTGGKGRIPAKVGEHILFFAFNSRLSGIGLDVNAGRRTANY